MAAEIASDTRPSTIPRPGEIYDPVARALDLIGDKWTLVLVRQLLAGPTGFQELRARTGIAPRVLSMRLRQLVADGYVIPVNEGKGARSQYAVTDRGRTLEPIIASIARWWVVEGVESHDIDTRQYTATSPQSILEALPFVVREDRAQGVDLRFEIRLTGTGGGVWTVHVHDGHCDVTRGFAERADVRYTADARVWAGVALGRLDARDAVRRGLLIKDGGREAMDDYFHQIARHAAKPVSDEEIPEAGPDAEEFQTDEAKPRRAGRRLSAALPRQKRRRK